MTQVSRASDLLISVIVCTYNRPKGLLETLESLERQTVPYEQFEVVVVDNNSAPPTREAVEQYTRRSPYNLTYVHEKSIGLPYAKNAGIAAAKAETVVFLDDDEITHPTWIENHLRGLNAASDVAAVTGRVWLIWNGMPPRWLLESELIGELGLTDWGDFHHAIDLNEYMAGGNSSYRKRVFDEVGLFNPAFPNSEDTELEARLRANGSMLVYSPDAIIFHQVPAERLTTRFFYQRAFKRGRHYVRMNRRGKVELPSVEDGQTGGKNHSGPNRIVWALDRSLGTLRTARKMGLHPDARVPVVRALSFCAGIIYETIRPEKSGN